MRRALSKSRLLEHLNLCIDMASGRQLPEVAEVLRNLQQEIQAGEFDETE